MKQRLTHGVEKDAHGTTRIVLAAIVGNGLVAVAKAFAWIFTGSPSMMAETIHSLADTANQSLIFVGIRQGSRGPSKIYPLGQASARYLWNLVSAMGIFFIGFGVTLYHGIHALLTVNERTDFSISWVTITILALSFFIEGRVLLSAFKEVKRSAGSTPFIKYIQTSDDPTVSAVLLEDGIAVFGVILALAGILSSSYFQNGIPDAAASIVIALLLGFMAVLLAITNGRLLIGKSASEDVERKIRTLLEKQPSVEQVIHLVTRIVGPFKIRLSCEIEFHGSAIIDRRQLAHDIADLGRGEDPTKILINSSRRTVRRVGLNINQIETILYKAFPQLIAIDIEVH